MNYKEVLRELDEMNVLVLHQLQATNLAEAEEEFLAQPELTRPNLEYGNLDRVLVDRNLSKIKAEGPRFLPVGYDDYESKLLEEYGNEVFRKNRLLQCVYNYNNLTGDSVADYLVDRMEHGDALYALNSKLYGEPDRATFMKLLQAQLQFILGNFQMQGLRTTRRGSEAMQAYVRLLELLTEAGVVVKPFDEYYNAYMNKELLWVKDEIEQKFQALLSQKMNVLFRHIPQGSEFYSMEETKALLEKIINEVLPTETNFRVEIVPGKTAISVNQFERIFKLPGERDGYSVADLKNLVLGKMFLARMLRSVPFENSDYKVLSVGVPGYLHFEEGLASCIGQALRGTGSYVGADHYVNIGLAYFYQLSFRRVMEIRTLLNFLQDCRCLLDDNAACWRTRQHEAFLQTTRCFRGTDTFPCFKDLMIYTGSVKVWRYIAEKIDHPNELWQDLFLYGKTDSTLEWQKNIARYHADKVTLEKWQKFWEI